MFYATFAGLLALAGLVTVLIMKQNKKSGSGKANSSTGSASTPATVVTAKETSAVDFEVLRTNATIPFIVMFHRSNCPACESQKPIFDRVAAELAGKVTFLKVSTDVEGNRPLARRMGVSRIPTHFVFKPGSTEAAASHVGLMDDDRLKAWIEASIK